MNGVWTGAWIILSKRILFYATDKQPKKQVDLRKARCIALQVSQESDHTPRTTDKGPNMLVDCSSGSLYLRMWTSRETKVLSKTALRCIATCCFQVWCHIIKIAAHNNGADLENQQLTKNDIPVIVEKCINFIYVHGNCFISCDLFLYFNKTDLNR